MCYFLVSFKDIHQMSYCCDFPSDLVVTLSNQKFVTCNLCYHFGEGNVFGEHLLSSFSFYYDIFYY